MESENLKICSKYNETKTLDNFKWPQNYKAICKSCLNEEKRIFRLNYLERKQQKDRELT